LTAHPLPVPGKIILAVRAADQEAVNPVVKAVEPVQVQLDITGVVLVVV